VLIKLIYESKTTPYNTLIPAHPFDVTLLAKQASRHFAALMIVKEKDVGNHGNVI
jgi:hypothetical protein